MQSGRGQNNVKTAVPASITHIGPSRGWFGLDWAEFARYRETLYFLAWREVKVRYKQTVLGVLWVLLQPLMTMIIFSVFFGRLAKIPSDGVPYPLFALVGVVPWTFFSSTVNQGSNSLIANAGVLKKIYFPRLMVPLSVVLAAMLDLVLSLGLLGVAMLWYQGSLGIQALWMFAFLLLAAITALGTALWMSALNAQYRDVRYVVPFLLQMWMFATPVVYPSSLLSGQWRMLYGLNPMAGAIEGLRWSLLSSGSAPGRMVWVSILVAITLLVTGALYFRKSEKYLADVI